MEKEKRLHFKPRRGRERERAKGVADGYKNLRARVRVCPRLMLNALSSTNFELRVFRVTIYCLLDMFEKRVNTFTKC